MSYTQMFNIASRLYPDTDYYSLNREQMSIVMEEYNDWN